MPAASPEQQAPRSQEVFISYSRKDKEFVRRLDEELKRRDRGAWVDWEGIPPGDTWEKTIYRAIESTHTFIFVLTPDSIASEVCGREIGHAVANNKRLVPIVHRDVTADTVPKSLGELNWIFFRDGDDFNEATGKLISALDTDLDWVRAHTRLLTRAIEWDANGRNNSFVLRGEDLRAAEQWLAQAPTKKEANPTALQAEYISASRKAATRRQRITLGAVIFGLVVAIVLAVVAFYQRNIAEERRRVAEARQLEAQAGVALDSSGEGLQKSALLAVESLKKAWTTEGYIACTRAISLLPLRPNIRPAHKKKVLALAYSPDGRWLASEDADATLVIWDTVAKKQFTLKTPRSNFVFYAALAVSPDSKWLVSTNGRDALIWNTETWQQVRKLAHRDMVWSLAFSPVGDLLATASYHSSEVKLYRTSTWEEIAPSNELAEKQSTEEQKGGSWVRAVAFSPNGQWLARAGDSITIWDMTAGTKLYGAENFKARSLAFNPDNQTLIAGGEAGGLTLITLAGGMNAGPFAEQTAQVREVQFSTDGRYVVSARGDPGSSSEVVTNGVVSVWDVESERELLRVPREAVAAIFAPHGNTVVTGNADGTVAEWSTLRGAAVKHFAYSSPATAVAFSPRNGQFLVTASADGQMHILKMEADTWRQVASKELAGKVSTVAFSPNGQWLLAISDESLRLFSVPSWKEALSQLDPEGSVDGISFSPDGKWIALKSSTGRHGSVTTTRVFELATRRAAGWFTDPASSNVPRSQITSGGDQKLVGNSASWPTIRLGGQAAKSSDGRWITDPWKDPWKGLTLTDAQLQRPAVIVQHDGKVTDAAFSPNGRWLATASEDRSVCMWPLWAEDLLPLARLRLQRNLTYDEWRQAFENEPYSKTCPDLPIDPKFVEAGQKLAEKGDVKGATAIFRRAMELQPDLKLDPKAEAQRLAEAAKRANAAKTTEQERP